MHPSESLSYFICRILAYALNFQEGIEFGPGLGQPDEPPVRVMDRTAVLRVWIDVGQPSARRLHKASKTGAQVMVYIYRLPENLRNDLKEDPIHRREALRVFEIPESFLKEIGSTLERDNRWTLLVQEGHLLLGAGGREFETDLKKWE